MHIIYNAIRCNICGACSVDGGKEYLRRLYAQEGCFTELSVFEKEAAVDN